MGSASLMPQVAGVTTWHINADEPAVLDYNTNFKTTNQIASLFAPDEFRASDHDPILVDLSLTPIQHTLTVTRAGSGTGSVTSSPPAIDCGPTCSAQVDQGSVITLTALAATGSTFAGWTGDCTGTAACSFVMDSAKAVTATFTLKTYALTVSTDGTGSGTVQGLPANPAAIAHGTVVTLTATPDTGSTFTGWTGAGCAGTGACVVTMDAAKPVTATFDLISYPMTVSQPVSGTIHVEVMSGPQAASPQESYPHGTVLRLTAVPDQGYAFVSWTGDVSGSENPTLVAVEGPMQIGALFAAVEQQHTIYLPAVQTPAEE
jgi:trimeric autotransporter adhesin